MNDKTKRARKNFTLRPKSIKALEKLARDLNMSMSRVLEAAIDAMAEKRGNARVKDSPRTWAEADALLASLPNKADLEKKHE